MNFLTVKSMLAWILCLLLAFGFTVRGSSTSILLLLSFISFGSLLVLPKVRNGYLVCWGTNRMWIIVMCMLAVLILVRELVSPLVQLKHVDASSRLMLAIPLFALIYSIGGVDLNKIRWGFFFGVLGMFFSGLYNYHQTGDIRLHSAFTNTIPFGAFCFVFALIFSIWSYGKSKFYSLASIFIFILSLMVVFLSQSRGVWVGCIVASIFLLFVDRALTLWKTMLFVFLGVTLIVVAYLNIEIFQARVDITISEFNGYFIGKRDGSVDMRMDMAWASFYILKLYPIFGVGRDLVPMMSAMHQNGLIDANISDAADLHGELFYNIASLGVFGLVYFILFYWFTTYPYFVLCRFKSGDLRRIGLIGCSISIVFFFTGFTHITFGLAMYASIYAVIQAVLLSSSVCFQREMVIVNGD